MGSPELLSHVKATSEGPADSSHEECMGHHSQHRSAASEEASSSMGTAPGAADSIQKVLEPDSRHTFITLAFHS